MEQHFQPVERGALALQPLQHLGQWLEAVFRLMWEYRFLYDNLPDLLGRSQALRQQYLAVQRPLIERIEAIMQALADSGLIASQPDEHKALVRTLHMVLSGWISYKKIMSGQQPLSQQHLYQGLLQILMIVKPYLTATGRPGWQALQERYTQLASPAH